MPDKTLLLVDGTGVAYRAFYAIAGLSTSGGRPTNAVFGFIKMLQQMQQAWKPTHWAVVFDGGLPEERMERLATYKAQRAPMPDALDEQFEPIEDYLARAGVCSLRVERQEADDVMASMAEWAKPASREVLIASSDKDLYQLVGERLGIVPPTKLGARMGPAEVLEKTGVPPERIVEWLALTGDSVDNIPGVPGVGPKTAAKLLSAFGSLKDLRDRLAEVGSAKLREAISAHWADVERNVQLVTLRRDLPLSLGWEDLRRREPRPEKLLPFYEEMEFRSLAQAAREEVSRGPTLAFDA